MTTGDTTPESAHKSGKAAKFYKLSKHGNAVYSTFSQIQNTDLWKHVIKCEACANNLDVYSNILENKPKPAPILLRRGRRRNDRGT